MLLPRRRLLLAALAAPFGAAEALADDPPRSPAAPGPSASSPATGAVTAPASAAPAPDKTAGIAPQSAPSSSSTSSSSTLPTSTDLDFREIQVTGDKALGRRFLLCVPKHLKAGDKVPLVVLLHGLGETGDERMGIQAWVQRYGLATAYERLRKTPIARVSKRRDWTDARLAEVNASLKQKAFSGLCLVCPFTPNVHKLPNPTASLDAYASWIVDTVIPRARKDAPVHTDAARTAIDGCSLGGYMALEVFARKPDAFGAFGGVQAAVSEFRAPGYAERIAKALGKTPKPCHLLTSEGDPFLPGNKKLAAELAKKSVPCDLRVLPGPHDQPWLREAGSIELLLWHDRRKKP